MTATAHHTSPVAPAPEGAPSAASRIWGIVRVQFINRYTFVWIPAIILASEVLVSLAIYAMIGSDQPMYGGAVQAPLWYFVGAGVQAMSLTFPFAQALTATRREFFLGTALAALLAAGALSLIVVVLGYVEQATTGYGINGYIAHLPWLWTQGGLVAGLLYLVLTLLVFFVGFWMATLYRRGGAFAVTIAAIGLGVVIVGVLFVVSRFGLWSDVLRLFADLGPLGVTGYVSILVALAAVAGWLTLRRSTP
jgi:hypothetical protein